MSRTVEQKEYHAAKEREYRAKKRAERDLALVRLGEAASTLLRQGYTPGQLLDLIVRIENFDDR